MEEIKKAIKLLAEATSVLYNIVNKPEPNAEQPSIFDSLINKTIPELKQICKAQNIVFTTNVSKANLIKSIIRLKRYNEKRQMTEADALNKATGKYTKKEIMDASLNDLRKQARLQKIKVYKTDTKQDLVDRLLAKAI